MVVAVGHGRKPQAQHKIFGPHIFVIGGVILPQMGCC